MQWGFRSRVFHKGVCSGIVPLRHTRDLSGRFAVFFSLGVPRAVMRRDIPIAFHPDTRMCFGLREYCGGAFCVSTTNLFVVSHKIRNPNSRASLLLVAGGCLVLVLLLSSLVVLDLWRL